jgi:hypothetical protein
MVSPETCVVRKSGAPAPLHGLCPAEGATSRDRGGLGLIVTVFEQVLQVRRNPHIGQE